MKPSSKSQVVCLCVCATQNRKEGKLNKTYSEWHHIGGGQPTKLQLTKTSQIKNGLSNHLSDVKLIQTVLLGTFLL